MGDVKITQFQVNGSRFSNRDKANICFFILISFFKKNGGGGQFQKPQTQQKQNFNINNNTV